MTTIKREKSRPEQAISQRPPIAGLFSYNGMAIVSGFTF